MWRSRGFFHLRLESRGNRLPSERGGGLAGVRGDGIFRDGAVHADPRGGGRVAGGLSDGDREADGREGGGDHRAPELFGV